MHTQRFHTVSVKEHMGVAEPEVIDFSSHGSIVAIANQIRNAARRDTNGIMARINGEIVFFVPSNSSNESIVASFNVAKENMPDSSETKKVP